MRVLAQQSNFRLMTAAMAATAATRKESSFAARDHQMLVFASKNGEHLKPRRARCSKFDIDEDERSAALREKNLLPRGLSSSPKDSDSRLASPRLALRLQNSGLSRARARAY